MSRIEKLRALIDARYEGSRAKFARAIGRSPSQVSQWVNGHMNFGDAGARLVEIAIGLPQGYFDGAYRAEQPVSLYAVPAPPADDVTRQIIDMLERTDETGRAMALAAVKVALAGHKPRRRPR